MMRKREMVEMEAKPNTTKKLY